MGTSNDAFANLANGVEGFFRPAFNIGAGPVSWVSQGLGYGGAGDWIYGTEQVAAQSYVNNVNTTAINRATANGATPFQAIQAGTNAINNDPLVAACNGTANTYNNIHAAVTNPGANALGSLTPLLIGAGVLGAGYLAVNAMGSGSSKSPRSRRN